MLCPNQQRSFLAGIWTKGMIVVRSLTLAGTRIGPQLSHNMSGHTTRIAQNIECQKYLTFFEKYDAILFRHIFWYVCCVLRPMLCLDHQRLCLQLHPLTLTGTTIQTQLPHEMARHTTRIASKNECRKYFKRIDAICPPFLLISWLCIGTNALSKSTEVISGR